MIVCVHFSPAPNGGVAERRAGMRRIVVTGAASGIGAALATALVAEGCEVLGIDRRPDVPEGVVPVLCDLSDLAAVRRVADGIPGPIDGLANIAGVPGPAPARTVISSTCSDCARSPR